MLKGSREKNFFILLLTLHLENTSGYWFLLHSCWLDFVNAPDFLICSVHQSRDYFAGK